jgi:hypothetical protein
MAAVGYPNLSRRNFQLVEIVRQRAGEDAAGNTNKNNSPKSNSQTKTDCLMADLDLRMAEVANVSGF